jgi:hypothetical protein
MFNCGNANRMMFRFSQTENAAVASSRDATAGDRSKAGHEREYGKLCQFGQESEMVESLKVTMNIKENTYWGNTQTGNNFDKYQR